MCINGDELLLSAESVLYTEDLELIRQQPVDNLGGEVFTGQHNLFSYTKFEQIIFFTM